MIPAEVVNKFAKGANKRELVLASGGALNKTNKFCGCPSGSPGVQPEVIIILTKY
jgi:hypothetical protein